MVYLRNLLIVSQLVCMVSRIQANGNDSEETYTSERFTKDLANLKLSSKQEVSDQYIKIVNNILRSNVEVIFEELGSNDDVNNFLSKCLKEIQLVYEADDYGLYFSSQREDSTEPVEGFVVFIQNEDMNVAKHLLKLVKDVYLTIHIRSPYKYLSIFLHVEQFCSFITGLCVEYCINERNQASLPRPKVIDKREVDKLQKLKTLKLVNIEVPNELLKILSNNTLLENLIFINCVFTDTLCVNKKNRSIDVAFQVHIRLFA